MQTYVNPLSDGARKALLVCAAASIVTGLVLIYEQLKKTQAVVEPQTPIFNPPLTTTV